MDAAVLQQALDDIFDHALVHHAFTDYMRDYEVIVHTTADPRTGIAPAYLRYLFRHCVEAEVRTVLGPELWRRSWDDRFLGTGEDTEADGGLDGYVWGVRWQCLYPGAEIVRDSARARRWAREAGNDFHEVRVSAGSHVLTLVFSDLQVTEVPEGYVPFRT